MIEALDDEFFALLEDRDRNLTRVMAIYMARHLDEFFVDGSTAG